MPKPLPVRGPNRALGCALLGLLVSMAFGSGCAHPQRGCVPTGLLAPETTVDLNAEAHADLSHEQQAFASALARVKATQAAQPDPLARKYNVLALSGGGSYGAFSAGVLNGWTASGQRPQFDIVSGVSTGALIATYAFLGPRYDPALRQFYTTTTTADVYHKKFKPAGLWSDSFVSSEPLARMIEASVTPQLLCEVAQAHAQGRRLFIGTTNVDTGRLVIWDMGAIASRGNAEAIVLYRKIILASASAPGLFPPVNIDVTVNDRCYSELHVDGGTTAQVFFRASMLHVEEAQLQADHRPFAGSQVYVIVAGKAFPDPKCVENRALKVAASSLGALTYAQTRNDLVRIYTLTMLTGMDFHLATIPQNWPIHEESMEFDPATMRSLFDRGYQWTLAGHAWTNAPPVLDASQQSIPRAGTHFLAPLATAAP